METAIKYPDGANIVEVPLLYWLARSWLMVFAGEYAESAARVYVSGAPISRTRMLGTVVFSPPTAPRSGRWNVRDRRVVICDTGNAPTADLVNTIAQAGAEKIGIERVDISSPWWAARLGTLPPVQNELFSREMFFDAAQLRAKS